MHTIIIATRNAHKIDEIRAILGDAFRYLGLRDLPGAPNPEETGATFAENALIKARSIATWLLVPANRGSHASPGSWSVLADDSGLEVDALDGAPGVLSARFAADDFGITGNAPDAANNAKLLRRLALVSADQRAARFRCALAWVDVEPALNSTEFEGACEGRIGVLQRGSHGFGYDPLFTPEGFDETFAELGEETKNRISHRSRALAGLKSWLARNRSGTA